MEVFAFSLEPGPRQSGPRPRGPIPGTREQERPLSTASRPCLPGPTALLPRVTPMDTQVPCGPAARSMSLLMSVHAAPQECVSGCHCGSPGEVAQGFAVWTPLYLLSPGLRVQAAQMEP